MGDHAEDARAWDEARESRDLFDETRTYMVPEVTRETAQALLCVLPDIGERWADRGKTTERCGSSPGEPGPLRSGFGLSTDQGG